ncbi:MAG: L-rhamnose isomerase [Spirochaetales bacterium]|nr:L-rhamnose isomerase [Spirochaetales bacterium]
MSDNIQKAWEIAVEQYGDLGIDPAKAIENLKKVPLSIHCWQGDDVGGFETADSVLSGGGIQVTGNYPGKARNAEELRADLDKVYSMIPGSHRLNLHAIYGDFGGRKVDRDEIEAGHFKEWMRWSSNNKIPLDFNGSFFSHPKADDGFTLSSKDKGIRDFWIEHARRVRLIAAEFGKNQGSPCIENVWIPDGMKDIPVDRMGYRKVLKDALDEVFSEELPAEFVKDAVETKLFGIGSEAFVVGSHEFYMGYAQSRGKLPCLDLGHFHPTELIADKISSTLLFNEELLLHVSRPMRWDSDHVVVLNDDIRFLTEELVRSGALDRIHIGLDFFDATLNRIGAWSTGARSTLKGLLFAMLEPTDILKAFEEEGDYYGRIALLERLKTMPVGAVWDYYCAQQGVPFEADIFSEVKIYEKEILGKRS